MMPTPANSPPTVPPPAVSQGVSRLVLATSAAAALGTLAWAALRVRDGNAESAHLREELSIARQAERVTGAAARAVPAADPAAATADLERRLQSIESAAKVAAEKASARETELNGIIAFLRQENAAAQQTIERLSNPEPPPEPEPPPPPKKETGSKRRPR